MKPFLFLALLVALPLAGCGESVDNAPPKAAMTPRNDPPPKIPGTLDEKIQAIQNAPMPEEQKKREIARVKAGG